LCHLQLVAWNTRLGILDARIRVLLAETLALTAVPDDLDGRAHTNKIHVQIATHDFCCLAGQRAAPVDNQLAMRRHLSRGTDHGLTWHAVSHAALQKRISGLAARLTAALRSTVDSSGNAGQSLLTPSAAQQTAMGPLTAPDLQDALLILGPPQLTHPCAVDIGNQHTSNSTAAITDENPHFVEGACSYAASVLGAIQEWISKHQLRAR
jgi:hypothetical protein